MKVFITLATFSLACITLLCGQSGIGIGNTNPSTILEIEDLKPELRITDGTSQASGQGNLLGKLSWWSRDLSFGSDYEPIGTIELINTNNSATPDVEMVFSVWEYTAQGTTERSLLTLDPTGEVHVDGELSYGDDSFLKPVGTTGSNKTVMACGAVDTDGTLFDTAIHGVDSVTRDSTGTYTITFEEGMIAGIPILTATSFHSNRWVRISSVGNVDATVLTGINGSGALVDGAFTFIVIGNSLQ